jgi:hypothetical protein
VKNTGGRAGKKRLRNEHYKEGVTKENRRMDDCIHLGYHDPCKSCISLSFLLFQMTGMTDEFEDFL